MSGPRYRSPFGLLQRFRTRPSTAPRTPILLLLFLVACPSTPPTLDDPVRQVEAFLEDLAAGRTDAAWQRIDPADQTELQDRQRAWAEARGEPPDPSPAAALQAFGLSIGAKPETPTLASRPGTKVRVRVNTERGRSTTFGVVQDAEGTWRIRLLDALTPVETSTRGS